MRGFLQKHLLFLDARRFDSLTPPNEGSQDEKKGQPSNTYVEEFIYIFKWKAQNLLSAIFKCGGCESRRRVVRAVYGFTTPTTNDSWDS